jgi:hypothetical protein
MSLFASNYLEELPDDIKALVYNHVYKSRYSRVLKELLANISNRKHYKNLMHFLAYQGEPKINLVHYLAHYINVHNIRESRKGHTEGSIISLYKKHLTSANIANHNINKIKIPLNLYTYLDKIIAKTFINFMNNSAHSWDIASHIHIDSTGDHIILTLEQDRYFACFADLYVILLSFWQFIRSRLYEFYELHKEAYNIHIHNLLKSDYDTGLYIWFGGNITDEILANNLVKMKNENASLYRKIIRQRRNIYKTECLYINFEIRNNIEGYTIEDGTIIMRLKEL